LRPFDGRGEFRVATELDGLRGIAVRGVGVTVLSQIAALAIQIAGTIVLARLLTPVDFGLIAMVTTFSLLLMNFGVNGFTEAVIQREHVDHALVSNLFWINASVGLLLTVAFAMAGPVLARFFGDGRLVGVAVAMSATIFITSLSVQHLALLKRGMGFAVLAVNDVVARAVSMGVSIHLAWAALGYWALVAGAVALPLATSVGAWASCRWIPGRPRRREGTASMLRFAMNAYGHFAANYCTRNIDNVLVGWFFGPQSLGFYKKAYDLCVLPVGQLSNPLHAVAIPTLSRLCADPEKQRRYILRALSTLAFIGMGLGAALALCGDDLILVLLGRQWAESGRILRFFGPGIGAMLLYLAYTWIHLSIGRADRLLRWGIVELLVIGVLFAVALPWGPVGIATAWVVSCWLLVMPALWYAGRPAQLGVGPVVGAVWRYVVAAMLAGVASAVIVRAWIPAGSPSDAAGAVMHGATVFMLFGALYLGAVIVLHGGCGPLRQVAALARDMMPARFAKSHATAPAVFRARAAATREPIIERS